MSPTTNLECLLIADDLTGACDAAVHFARRGRRTVVCLDPGWESLGASVLAISAESRDLSAAELRRVMDELAQLLPVAQARILFKKIDSTLRGNVGAEIAAAATAFGCEAAVITPAFPAVGRTVESGYLRVAGPPEFEPIEVAARLRGQGLEACLHTRPGAVAEAIDAGVRFISVDAACDEDLDWIAAAGLGSGRRILWAGSAGLASALARAAPGGAAGRAGDVAHTGRPVLFCIGSDHAVTMEQLRRLTAERAPLRVSAETAEPQGIVSALRQGQHVVLWASRGQISMERVRELIGNAAGAAAALALSGGDTASLVCRALGVSRIELKDEIAPGIPWGYLSGGAFDGSPVATKSGGFGGPHALIQVADFFT
ncbi:MAG: four-carbon acid sugar kinase family protein [Bryobacteraceae bacterium]